MAGDGDGGQGARDAATVLPFIAAILFLPPLILIFSYPVIVAGLPLILLYMFGAWAFVIACAYFLAPRLTDVERRPDDTNGNGGGTRLEPPSTGGRMPP